MFVQVINTTLRILFFRAGPQDFPYANGLTQVLVALAVAANALVFSRILPLAMSVAMAGAMVGAMALVTHSVLKARQMGNRFQQTFNALLATTAVLTLVLLPPFSQIAPQILQLAKNPELLTDPDAVKIPATAVFVMNMANFWNFAVTAHIFRHAAGVNLWLGLFIAFIAAGVVLFLGVLGGTLGMVLLGGSPAL
jgi:hypothetical protein